MSALPTLGFMESVKKVLLQNYVNFNGRARRSEFWYFYLLVSIINVIITTIYVILLFSIKPKIEFPSYNFSYFGYFKALPWYLKTILIIYIIIYLAFFLPSLGVTVRRLHDTGRSGWWVLLYFIPIVNIVGVFVLIYFCALDSKFEANEYGPSPKYMSVSEGGLTEGGVLV